MCFIEFKSQTTFPDKDLETTLYILKIKVDLVLSTVWKSFNLFSIFLNTCFQHKGSGMRLNKLQQSPLGAKATGLLMMRKLKCPVAQAVATEYWREGRGGSHRHKSVGLLGDERAASMNHLESCKAF